MGSFYFLVLVAIAIIDVNVNAAAPRRPNILFLMTDQQRWDAMQRAQDALTAFDNTLKLRTPNLDRLSREGAYFMQSYSHCPVCGPARTVLRTGCTVERTGVQTNDVADDYVQPGMMDELFKDKVEALQSIDQILVEDYNYVSEYYGKWHIPDRFFRTRDGSQPVIRYNTYNYRTGNFGFSAGGWGAKYRGFLNHFRSQGQLISEFSDGDQADTYSRQPYGPITLDSRFGSPTNTNLFGGRFNAMERSQNSVKGIFRLGDEYTSSYFNHDIAMKAMNRLAVESEVTGNPWFITVSYHHPHPPMMPTPNYLDYYWNDRDRLLVSPTIHDEPDNSGYYWRQQLAYLEGQGYLDENNVQEWIALYYALVEEIDVLIGEMLDRLDELELTDNTIVMFTSDHGEMLGAHHGMRGKAKFFEEAVKVPLFFKYPGHIAPGTVVKEPVSHVDVVATLLDYANADDTYDCDGTSLRRFIESTSYNANFDEGVAVSEWDYRHPIDDGNLHDTIDGQPNYAIWHGEWKLIIHKLAFNPVDFRIDMLYNLANDPNESNNFVGRAGNTASLDAIGKAEHLRVLLLEWMVRMDGDVGEGYYTDPKFNAGEGRGDVVEIFDRQSWRRVDFWASESSQLTFSAPTRQGDIYLRNEYFYVGRRTPGVTVIDNITIEGADAGAFSFSVELMSFSRAGMLRLSSGGSSCGDQDVFPPLVEPVRTCSVGEKCQRCEGHCVDNSVCADGLVCSNKGGGGNPVPGCFGTDNSNTEWCVRPQDTVPCAEGSSSPTTFDVGQKQHLRIKISYASTTMKPLDATLRVTGGGRDVAIKLAFEEGLSYPSPEPTPEPTGEQTTLVVQTAAPTDRTGPPTSAPTVKATVAPTRIPIAFPTVGSPHIMPTASPIGTETGSPVMLRTPFPVEAPTMAPQQADTATELPVPSQNTTADETADVGLFQENISGDEAMLRSSVWLLPLSALAVAALVFL